MLQAHKHSGTKKTNRYWTLTQASFWRMDRRMDRRTERLVDLPGVVLLQSATDRGRSLRRKRHRAWRHVWTAGRSFWSRLIMSSLAPLERHVMSGEDSSGGGGGWGGGVWWSQWSLSEQQGEKVSRPACLCIMKSAEIQQRIKNYL